MLRGEFRRCEFGLRFQRMLGHVFVEIHMADLLRKLASFAQALQQLGIGGIRVKRHHGGMPVAFGKRRGSLEADGGHAAEFMFHLPSHHVGVGGRRLNIHSFNP
ncbi:hypothetical protein C1H84_14155 [Glutamicibacter soli]|uniref:Uncharacterized protein n=1 Tax=Glutamicibacter soli TaxID=453836 RepID=A0A365YAC0_9MICC|nr:hypothetical protein C1H84_14155 [Glutamicibacter soli]